MDSRITIKEFGESYSGVDMKSRTIAGKISTIYQDRDQEVVPPSALETDIETYKLNPILILSHNHKSLPIGKMTDIKFNSDHVWAKFYITKNPIGDEVLTLAQEGILNGFSSGFVPLEFKENPQVHEVPSIALKTSLGRKTKKIYKRCELVEVSMLAIPSNRQSLIDRTEKGNKAADLVFKAFYGDEHEDLTMVLKELLVEENPPPVYTLKALWQEDLHPRDRGGEFTDKPGNLLQEDVNVRDVVADIKTNVRQKEVTTRLDESIKEQQLSREALNDIRNNTDWSGWLTKWGIRAAMAVGSYLLFNKVLPGTSAAIKSKIHSFLGGAAVKGFDPDFTVSQVLSLLTDIRDALTKGRELGMEDSSDYQRLLRSYNDSEDRLREIAGYGLKSLLDGIVIKEMTAEDFKEEEHPRHTDGKFRRKSEGAGVKNAKAPHVTEALNHPDVPGAGAAKRKSLPLTPQEKFGVVMSEFKRGTLRSGSGQVVTDPQQAKAIAISESKKVTSPATTKSNVEAIKDWVVNNKGKTFLAAVVAPVAAFKIAKFGGRAFQVFYSNSSKTMVKWGDLTIPQRKAFLAQAQPGDIYMQGETTPGGIIEMAKDSFKGKRVAIDEVASKMVNNGEYPHSALIVGHYDDAFHNRIVQALKGKRGKIEQKAADDFIKLTHDPNRNHPEGKKFLERFMAAKKGKDEEFFNDLRKWNDGKVLLTLASNSKDAKGHLLLMAVDQPWGGGNGTGAILRTKLPLERRRDMSDRIISFVFQREVNPKFKYHSKESANFDVAYHTIMATGPEKRAIEGFVKDDRVICSGLVARLYKDFGGLFLQGNRHLRYATPSDLVKDNSFASMILEMQKKVGYNFNDWIKNPETVINRGIQSNAKIAVGGVGALAVGGVGAKVALDQTKPKGLSDLLIVTKAMTEQEFEESEHPRAPKGSEHGGEFIAKPGTGGGTLGPTKGSHGGAREAAGRLPKEAHSAVPKLKERFRKQNPGASEEQITQMVSDYAKDPSHMKPDYLEFIESPDSYFKKLEEDRRNSMLSKMRKIKYGDGTVKEVESSGATGEVVDEVKNSVSKWNRAIGQAKSLKQAKETYSKEDASASEINAARLIYGTAFVATAIGLATVIRGTRGFTRAGFKPLKAIEGEVGSEYGSLYRSVEHAGTTDPMSTVKNTWFRAMNIKPDISGGKTAKVAEIDPWNEIYASEVGFWNRLMGRIGNAGEGKTIVVGPSLVGRGPASRFRLPEWKITNRSSGNYNLQPLDTDPKTGLRLLNARGKPELINIAIATGKIKQPELHVGDLPPGLKLSEDGKEWIIRDEHAFMEHLSSDEVGLFTKIKPPKGPKPKATPAEGEGEISVGKDFGTHTVGNDSYALVKGNLPELIAQTWSGKAHEAWKIGSEAHRGLFHFLEGQVWPSVSRKTLAFLTVATGGAGGGAFYFQQDIENLLRVRGKQDEGAYEAADKIRKVKEAMRRQQGSVADKELIKLQTANLRAQKEAAVAKARLETLRENVIDKLVNYGFRSELEGAVTPFGRTIPTIIGMGPVAQAALVKRALTKDLLKKYGYVGEDGLIELQTDLIDKKKKARQLTEEVLSNIEKDKEFQQHEVKVVPAKAAIKNEVDRVADVEEPKTTEASKEKPVTKRIPAEEVAERKAKRQRDAEAKLKKEAGFYDIIVKAMNETVAELDDSDIPIDIDEITTAIAEELATMIADMSTACRLMIENGVPGHSKYEEINDILVEIYAYMKDRAKTGEPENTEISQKSFDKSFETPYMSTQHDPGGGMFTGNRKPNLKERCPKCQNMATEETVSKCEKADCPYSFVDMIAEKQE